MNDAWEANADGVCQPKAEYFALHCNADGMMVEMAPEVVPNALEVSIGSCSGSTNVDTGKWEVNSALDGCSTSLSTGQGPGHSIKLKNDTSFFRFSSQFLMKIRWFSPNSEIQNFQILP